MTTTAKKIRQGMETAFINGDVSSEPLYKSQFLSNDYKEGKKVLCSLTEELAKCDSFYISVAFITMSGVTPLLQTLKELEERGIKGRILTTDYLTFSEPKALKKLHQFENIDIKMYCVDGKNEGFHTKGYIFEEENLYKIIIGSSNLTLNALTKNKEWNTKIVSTKDGEYAKHVLDEFDQLWQAEETKAYPDFIEQYELKYKIAAEQKKIVQQQEIPNLTDYKLQPNSMQLGFINNLMKLQNDGENKALLISATGTGKTFASAFALREMKAKRVLFIVHREQILKQAKKSFQRVFNHKIDMGLVSGNEKNWNSDFVFSTVQTMSKEESLERYAKDHFDYIVIDEVHRAGGNSYQKIMDYFTPKFLLGMTASPERTDGFDIYGLFDHNIAHEIRLENALEEDLLCPFHYFGITDFEAQADEVAEESTPYETKKTLTKKEKAELKKIQELREFNRLVSEKRVDYIIKQINYYSYSGDRVKGLVFCSRNDEAKELSQLFNQRGFKTVALSGSDSIETRMESVDRLTTDDTEDYIDYIFTVDIFNEGIDIPEINQVVMLRPTESPIVFVQQLGRGLRKSLEKEYVVIIDFIGNYQNNFMIPVALSGDKSYNKDNIRKTVREGNRTIPGCSSIHFDEISRQRIYKSIDAAKFKQVAFLKKEYFELKNKIGKIPGLMDFETYGSMDVLLILEYSQSYYKFLEKYDKEYTYKMDKTQENMLRYVSAFFSKGKRLNEVIAMRYLLDCFKEQVPAEEQDLLTYFKEELVKQGKVYDQNVEINIINILTNNFLTGGSNKSFLESIFIEERSGKWGLSDKFSKALEYDEFYRMIEELIEFWAYRHQQFYAKNYLNRDFCLYEKYNYDDVCRLLNWDKAHVPLNIGGYKFDQATNTYPVFINYEKDDDISDTINYHDRFMNNRELIAISKSKRTIKSDDVQKAMHAEELGIQRDLFIRKNKDDDEAKEFYYMGKITATGQYEAIKMAGTNEDAVEIFYHLDVPVRDDIYDYIIN